MKNDMYDIITTAVVGELLFVVKHNQKVIDRLLHILSFMLDTHY